MKIDFLPEATRTIFNILVKQPFISHFTLVGGTALTLQIHHRLSEDLDFIFDGDELDTKLIKRNIHRLFKKNYKIIKQDENYQIDFIINKVKVTFFSTGAIQLPFHVQKYSIPYQKSFIATPEIIAVLKLNALVQRNTIRDYYDLYYLAKYVLSISDIFKKCKQLLPNLSSIVYSETIIYTKDIKESSIDMHLEPQEKITKNQIAEFFIKELKKMNPK